MTTAWSHLPNAIHIDRVLASVKSNAGDWGTPNNSITKDDAYHTAWNVVTSDMPHWTALGAAWDAALSETVMTGWHDIRDAMLTLVAYDDCAYMLDSDPSELAMIAAFGDERAIMLLPACIALSKEKSK